MSEGNELSFLPEGYLARKKRRRAWVTGLSIVCVVTAMVGAAALGMQQSIDAFLARSAQATAAYSRAAGALEPMTHHRRQQRQIIEHAALAAGLIESVPRSNVLAELTNALPAGASLLDVAVDAAPRVDTIASAGPFDMRKATADAKRAAEQLAAPAPPVVDVVVHLTGQAESDQQVAEYLTSLGASALFRDVNLVISEATPNAGGRESTARRFQIQLSLKSDGAFSLPIRSQQITAAHFVD